MLWFLKAQPGSRIKWNVLQEKAALILLIRDNYSSLDFILSWMLNEVNAFEVTARNSSFLCGK